jgi:hypothetical protein
MPSWMWSSDDFGWWPAIMPSHREVIAAHLLTVVPRLTEGQWHHDTAVLPRLAENTGSAGVAMAYVLAYGLAAEDATARAAATDALLTMVSRGQLPATELGLGIAQLVQRGVAKLNRLTGALRDATHAGAHAEVWTAVAAALPGLLPDAGEKPPPGLAGFCELGVETATAARARARIPELAAVAARGGASQFVRAARRLQRQLGNDRP